MMDETKMEILFKRVNDGPDLVFVEVEDGRGNSISAGQWSERDGYSVLTIAEPNGGVNQCGLKASESVASSLAAQIKAIRARHGDEFAAEVQARLLHFTALTPTKIKREMVLYRDHYGMLFAGDWARGFIESHRLSEPVTIEFTLLPGESA